MIHFFADLRRVGLFKFKGNIPLTVIPVIITENYLPDVELIGIPDKPGLEQAGI